MLLSVINVRSVTQELVQLFQGCGFANFALFAPLFSLLPAEYQGDSGFNALSDSSRYHPYIFSMLRCCFPTISRR